MRSPMRARKVREIVVVAAMMGAGGVAGFLLAPRGEAPREREITIRARQYAYEPEVIRVNRGDTLKLRFIAEDVVHGFFLEGHDLDVKILPLVHGVEVSRPSRPGEAETAEEVVVVADREGKFRYRCSHTCGYMHPFMQGELIVSPNRLYPVSLGMGLGLLAATLGLTAAKARRQ